MGGICLVKDDKQLIAMMEQPYNSEKLLQRLLEEHPLLLAGDQINSETPRKWLHISREVPVPGTEGGANRWSVDHLFLDQDGIPTLVEVKRSSDTRIRRAVVGQMLDYAANAVLYWPFDWIRSRFEAQYAGEEDDSPKLIGAQLDLDIDIEQFWQRVRLT
ncbi:MAG: hypothetical protein ACXV3D_07250 [Halobacteriota archaeon]